MVVYPTRYHSRKDLCEQQVRVRAPIPSMVLDFQGILHTSIITIVKMFASWTCWSRWYVSVSCCRLAPCWDLDHDDLFSQSEMFVWSIFVYNCLPLARPVGCIFSLLGGTISSKLSWKVSRLVVHLLRVINITMHIKYQITPWHSSARIIKVSNGARTIRTDERFYLFNLMDVWPVHKFLTARCKDTVQRHWLQCMLL